MDLKIAFDHRDRVEEFRRKHRIGLLTLLFTDMVGSTQLKQTLGDPRAFALIQEHHTMVREILAGFPEGEEIGTAGDSFFIVFAKPSEAAQFSLLLQSGLRELSQNSTTPLLVRIGIHIGEVIIEERPNTAKPKDLYGIQVDICARVMSLGQGNQILMTRSAFDNARQVLKGQKLTALGPLSWANHGRYLLQGVDEPIEICEVGETGCAQLSPPPDSKKARRAETEKTGFAEVPGKRRALRFWPHTVAALVAVAVLVLIAGHGHLRGRPAAAQATVLFRCGFETNEGYQEGQSLIDRNGWMRGGQTGGFPAHAEGVAAGLLPGSAQQGFLGGVAGSKSPGIHAVLSRRLTYSPNPGGESMVKMSWQQRVTDSTSGARNSFEWLFFDQQGQMLGGLLFDNLSCKIMRRRPDNSLTDTGLTFERGRIYPVKLQLDFKAKTWTAMIGAAALGAQTLADRDRQLNLGKIVLTWWTPKNNAPSPDGSIAGNNLMAFDDLEITALDAPAP